MTADGSDDDMITPQGLEPYNFYNFFISFLLIAWTCYEFIINMSF